MEDRIMKRLALLVGSTKGGEYLSCINNDLDAFENHLKSNYGGAYEHHEIKRIYNPSYPEFNEIINYTKHNGYNFLFFYWTGHGGTNSNGDLEIQIDDENSVNEINLLNIASKQVLIFDTCRKQEDEVLLTPTIGAILESATEAFTADREVYRNVYNGIIGGLSHELEVYYSCSRDEISYAGRNLSKFTNCLFRAYDNWNASAPNSSQTSIHNIVDTCTPCCQRPTRKMGSQTPDMFVPKVKKFFPFAIKL